MIQILWLFLLLNYSFGKTIEYETLQGKVRGEVRSARNGRTFHAFLGVPYARPPIGEFRWQPPQAPPDWQGTLDATKLADVCTQDRLYQPSEMEGSEDCLYLNVFTSPASEGKLVDH